MKPARHSPLLVLSLALVFFAIGCRTASPEVGPTAESQIVVEAPALPTATVEPTSTTAPTVTPSPTLAPTETPTPEPTATPRPTRTPEPTATATTPPTATPPAAPPPPPATNTPSVDTRQLLYDQITAALVEVHTYVMELAISHVPGPLGTTRGVDCAVSVQSYDRAVSSINLDVTGSDATVQNAYTLARSGIDQFVAIAQPWTDGCRQSLADGEQEKSIPKVQADTLTTALRAPEDLLQQALRLVSP